MNREELRARVAEALTESQGPVMPATLAGRFGVTELEAVRALPGRNAGLCPGLVLQRHMGGPGHMAERHGHCTAHGLRV